jgi:hypothetical protein
MGRWSSSKYSTDYKDEDGKEVNQSTPSPEREEKLAEDDGELTEDDGKPTDDEEEEEAPQAAEEEEEAPAKEVY